MTATRTSGPVLMWSGPVGSWFFSGPMDWTSKHYISSNIARWLTCLIWATTCLLAMDHSMLNGSMQLYHQIMAQRSGGPIQEFRLVTHMSRLGHYTFIGRESALVNWAHMHIQSDERFGPIWESHSAADLLTLGHMHLLAIDQNTLNGITHK